MGIRWQPPAGVFVLVIGLTGAGKSTFINCALAKTDNQSPVSEDLAAQTVSILPFKAEHPTRQDRRVTLIDTPGFGAGLREDYKNLKTLSTWVGEHVPTGSRIVIIHLVAIDRQLSLELDNMSPERLTVHGIVQHSMIVTTKWGNLLNWDAGLQRHDEIRERFEPKIPVHPFLNTLDSAWKILDSIDEQPVDIGIFEQRLANVLPKPQISSLFLSFFVSSSSLPDTQRKETHVAEENRKTRLRKLSLEAIALLLTTALSNEDDNRKLLERSESESQAILDTFQTILRASLVKGTARRNMISTMMSLSAKTDLHPQIFLLNGVQYLHDFPIAGGNVADIYQGKFEGKDVCLKVIRNQRQSQNEKIIAREAIFWGQFSHPNIVPFYGIFRGGPEISLVSPWASNGDLVQYLRGNPKAERVLLCSDVAEGLNYLHQNKMIHGDLKAANVLIDESGRACITDFGLSSINDPDILHWDSASVGAADVRGDPRWQAPELFGIDEGGNIANVSPPNTQSSDVYAWACVCLEIFTGNLPFFGLSDTLVTHQVTIQKQKPSIPRSAEITLLGLSDDIRNLLDDCWACDPLKRPTTADLLSRLAPLKPKDTRSPISFKAGPTMSKDGLYDADVPLTIERLDMILSRTISPYSPVRLPNTHRAVEERLMALLKDVDASRKLLSRRGADAQNLLDAFHAILSVTQSEETWRNVAVAMKRLSTKAELYPRVFHLADVSGLERAPVGGGGFADIRCGEYGGQRVCLKTIRSYDNQKGDRLAKAMAREAVLWGHLDHPNLVPFYGIYTSGAQVTFVSPWADNGDLSSFLETNTEASRTLLCLDVTRGLEFLHRKKVVHGDLKGVNILVDNSHRAYLADFGLSGVDDPKILKWVSQSAETPRGGTLRYQAPELFGELDSDAVAHNTEASDMYAWACVCYEIFTGKLPFYEIRNDHHVPTKVMAGHRPKKPESPMPNNLSEALWLFMAKCWKKDPAKRPNVTQALSQLTKITLLDDRSPGSWKSGADMRKELSGTGHPLLAPTELGRVLFGTA